MRKKVKRNIRSIEEVILIRNIEGDGEGDAGVLFVSNFVLIVYQPTNGNAITLSC